MGIHLGNTDRRRWSLSRGSTEIELVAGLSRHDLPDGRVKPGVGYGRRMVPTDGEGVSHEWRFLVPWPRIQVYLRHTGGFNRT